MLEPIVKNHRRLCGLTSSAARDLRSAFAQEGRSRSRFSLRPRCGHTRLETLLEDVVEQLPRCILRLSRETSRVYRRP